MRNRRGRWVSACSTTPLSPRCMRARDGACSASRWWISTCTTATARRRCSQQDTDLFYASSHQQPVLSRHRRGVGARHRQQHRQCAAAPGRRQCRVPRGMGRHHPAGARPFRSRPADRFGWLRRAQGRPAGAAPAGDRGLCLDHRGAAARRGERIAAGGWSRCWRAATTWTRWPPRPRRMCAR